MDLLSQLRIRVRLLDAGQGFHSLAGLVQAVSDGMKHLDTVSSQVDRMVPNTMINRLQKGPIVQIPFKKAKAHSRAHETCILTSQDAFRV